MLFVETREYRFRSLGTVCSVPIYQRINIYCEPSFHEGKRDIYCLDPWHGTEKSIDGIERRYLTMVITTLEAKWRQSEWQHTTDNTEGGRSYT